MKDIDLYCCYSIKLRNYLTNNDFSKYELPNIKF